MLQIIVAKEIDSNEKTLKRRLYRSYKGSYIFPSKFFGFMECSGDSLYWTLEKDEKTLWYLGGLPLL